MFARSHIDEPDSSGGTRVLEERGLGLLEEDVWTKCRRLLRAEGSKTGEVGLRTTTSKQGVFGLGGGDPARLTGSEASGDLHKSLGPKLLLGLVTPKAKGRRTGEAQFVLQSIVTPSFILHQSSEGG